MSYYSKLYKKQAICLTCELVLCENLPVYLCISCCCTAKHLSFNLSSSLLSELTLLLQDPSMLGKNDRDQSEMQCVKCEGRPNFSGFHLALCSCTAHTLFSCAEWRWRISGSVTPLNCVYCLDAAASLLLVVIKYFQWAFGICIAFSGDKTKASWWE